MSPVPRKCCDVDLRSQQKSNVKRYSNAVTFISQMLYGLQQLSASAWSLSSVLLYTYNSDFESRRRFKGLRCSDLKLRGDKKTRRDISVDLFTVRDVSSNSAGDLSRRNDAPFGNPVEQVGVFRQSTYVRGESPSRGGGFARAPGWGGRRCW